MASVWQFHGAAHGTMSEENREMRYVPFSSPSSFWPEPRRSVDGMIERAMKAFERGIIKRRRTDTRRYFLCAARCQAFVEDQLTQDNKAARGTFQPGRRTVLSECLISRAPVAAVRRALVALTRRAPAARVCQVQMV